ncbi:MAG: radical SAM protein [Anaerolineales bacterium]
MYSLPQITEEKDEVREAVLHARAYKPIYVKIKVNYGCNLKCEMCKHWRETREPPISMNRFREIISELALLGCKKIHFSGGEPMLRPQLPDLVEHATQLGMRVTLTTNGTLIDKVKAKRLIEAGLRGVNVSIDSPLRKMHEKIRGVEGSFKQTTRAVSLFNKYSHKGKLTVRINTVVGRSNYQTLATLPDLAHELGADGINLIPVDDHCGEHLSMRKKDIALYNSEIAPIIEQRAGVGREHRRRGCVPVWARRLRGPAWDARDDTRSATTANFPATRHGLTTPLTSTVWSMSVA